MPVAEETLRHCEVWRALSEPLLTELAKAAEEVVAEPGYVLYRAGEPLEHVWSIHTGLVGVFAHTKDGVILCDILGPWKVLGVMAIGERANAILTVRVLMPSHLVRLNRRDVCRVIFGSLDTTLHVYQELIYLLTRRLTSIARALGSEEMSFPTKEACPSLRPTRAPYSANTLTGQIRGMCQRELACGLEEAWKRGRAVPWLASALRSLMLSRPPRTAVTNSPNGHPPH